MSDGKDAAHQAEPAASTQRAESPAAAAGPRAGNSAAHSAASTTEKIGVNSNFYAVDFRVHVSMRYHQTRRAWWTGLNRMSSVAAALAGSAAVITVWGKGGTPWAYIAGGSGAIAALNAALGFTDRAREHATLYNGFSAIAARMAKESEPDDNVARAYNSEVLLLEASEPPTIQSLNVFCHNQECEARGHGPEDLRKIYWYNRLFKSWFTVRDSFPSNSA